MTESFRYQVKKLGGSKRQENFVKGSTDLKSLETTGLDIKDCIRTLSVNKVHASIRIGIVY